MSDVQRSNLLDRMSAFQLVAVTICMFINALDGFDVLAIAFTGPQIAKQWALTPTELGLLFSSGLAGMTLGSLFLSPLADIFGRRALTLLGLVMISVGMLASATAHDLNTLMALRAFTGLGIGSLLSSINTIVTEYSSAKRRDFAISFMSIGYPVGATIGGTISVFLIARYGWPAVFIFGGLCSAVMIPIVLARLPESFAFLAHRKPRNALARANALLRKMNRAEIEDLAALDDTQAGAKSVVGVFSRIYVAPTVLICATYFLTMLSFYFMLNWTPKLLVDEGLSLSTGISGAILMNGGGVVGGLLFGASTRLFGLKTLGAIYMVLLFVGIAAFGFAGNDLQVLMALALFIGFFMIGSICALYATIGAMYPAPVRNTGTGLALGIGRLGAVTGPFLGGVLIAHGWTRPAYCLALALPLLVAAVFIRRVPLLAAGESLPARAA